MSKRRLERLEGSLSPKEAVLRWLIEAHAFGTMPAYAESLIDQPEATQPFVALPSQVEKAVYESMRGKRPGFIKEVTREASGDSIFLLRLVIGLNVHIEETLRVERHRRAALLWWSRVLDARAEGEADTDSGAWSTWRDEVSAFRGELSGTEQARRALEARYLDGHDCLFPDLAVEWQELCAAAEGLTDTRTGQGEEPARALAERRLQQVVLMARADALDASGQPAASDAMAARVLRGRNGDRA